MPGSVMIKLRLAAPTATASAARGLALQAFQHLPRPVEVDVIPVLSHPADDEPPLVGRLPEPAQALQQERSTEAHADPVVIWRQVESSAPARERVVRAASCCVQVTLLLGESRVVGAELQARTE